MSAIDYYSDFKIAETVVEKAQIEGATDQLKLKATTIQKFIESNATKISMKSFDEHFENIDVLAEAPAGLFLEDPTKAESTEELDYLLQLDQIQNIENRRVAMQALIQQKDIEVQMLPSLPQDVAQSIERLAGKASMSIKTFLTEVDGRSEEEAAEEVKRIQEEEEVIGSTSPFTTGVTMPEDFPSQDLGNQRGGLQSINPGAPVGGELEVPELVATGGR